MDGYVMQLQNMSVNDGEGIRTNIFLSGCPLCCAWCCNPEGQSLKNPLTRPMGLEELLQAVLRQLPFYQRSGGGVTLTGGECTWQRDFFLELTEKLYDAGLRLAMESCGYFDFEAIKPGLLRMELVFLDLKHMDPLAHKRFTGRDNGLILENIRRVYALGLPLVLRIPLILGANGDEGNIRESLAFMRRYTPGAALEFLPYHRYGEDKYAKLGLKPPPADFQTPDGALMAHYRELAGEYGIETVSYR